MTTTSSEDDKRRYQKTWRKLHPQTEKFWGGINRAAIQAVRKPGTTHICRQLSFIYEGDFLRITLPSGRALSYPSPRLATGKYGDTIVIFKDSAGGKWGDCRPIGFGGVEEFQRITTTLPDWATGLPIAAKVRNGPRFSKPEKAAPQPTTSTSSHTISS